MEEKVPLQEKNHRISPAMIALSVLVVLIIFAAFYFAFFVDLSSSKNSKPQVTKQTETKATESSLKSEQTIMKTTTPNVVDQVKSPHFVSSNPAHAAVLTSTVSEVTINFNFDLGPGSKIEVLVDNNDLVVQPAKISADKLSMKASFNPVQGATYTVKYIGCWPDGSCHPGSFVFSVK